MARWQRKQRRGDQKHRLALARSPEPVSRPGELLLPTERETEVAGRRVEVASRRFEVASDATRLAYTPTQAAQALGISRSTLYRLLPYLETIEMPWGVKLIPVDELERLVAERRRAALARRSVRAGRKPSIPTEVVERIRADHEAGKTLRQIAAELNADGTPTAHGGVK